jgi:hypothetical protein
MVQILNETTLLYIALSTLAGIVITAVTLWLRYKNTGKNAYVHGIFLPLLFTVLAALGVLGMGGYWLWWRAKRSVRGPAEN